MKAQNTLAKNQDSLAMAKYNNNYNNHLYQIATQGKSSTYANALIDEAMAICGSPYYRLSFRQWSKAALSFLAEF